MTENHYSEAEWQELDDEIQKRFRALADEISAAAPVEPRFGKTVTELFPLFSYVSFRRPKAKSCEYIIVGVDIAPENGQWRIHADISDEEEGTIFFELPRTPFTVSSFAQLKDSVLDTLEQLIDGGKPALLRLFGSSPPVMPGQISISSDVPRKSRVG
jgi:hypothetical protein